MKLVVFGPTGNTGLALLEQAPKLGHEITAFVRSADKLAGKPQLLGSGNGSSIRGSTPTSWHF